MATTIIVAIFLLPLAILDFVLCAYLGVVLYGMFLDELDDMRKRGKRKKEGVA